LHDACDRQRKRFGAEHVAMALSHAPASAPLAGEALLEAVMRHAAGVAPFDDLTLVCLSRDAP
jgi:serine phosphatase RsbU (regulator of sigma subunit)